MKLIFWVLILFWAGTLLLNVRAVHAIQARTFTVSRINCRLRPMRPDDAASEPKANE